MPHQHDLRLFVRLLLVATLLGACSPDPGSPGAGGAGAEGRTQQPAEETVLSSPSPDARSALARVRGFQLAPVADAPGIGHAGAPRVAVLREPPPGLDLHREGEWLVSRPSGSTPGAPHAADVRLPVESTGAFRVRHREAAIAVEVRPIGLVARGAEVVDGYAVYAAAERGGPAVVHRVTPEGTEDFVHFSRRPERAELEYEITLGGVAGLRLVGETVELLDEGGVPRLRMAPPYVVDASGETHAARVALGGCAYDLDPRGPWGRPPTPPGSDRCRIRLSWPALPYPAVLDPAWVTTGSMTTTRYRHTASLLQSGKVLVAGGYGSPTELASAELYDPATGTWSPTGSLGKGRNRHAAAVLPSGKVLVCGGRTPLPYADDSAELYDPGTGQWTPAATMGSRRVMHTATLLPNGKVLAAGGYDFSGGLALPSAEIYDPAANSWTATPFMFASHYEHAANLMPTGNVMVTGGHMASAEIYDYKTNTWGGSGQVVNRWRHTVTFFPNGSAILAGGETPNGYVATSRVYDPVVNQWLPGPNMPTPRGDHTATLLPSGRVLVAGGSSGAYQASALLYDPATNTWTSTGPMAGSRALHQATLLGSGQVLVAGGYSNSGGLKTAELASPLPQGTACEQPGECATGFCADGRCCDTACSSSCDVCSQALGATMNGTCTPASQGYAGSPSCGNYVCNGVGTVCPTTCLLDSHCASGKSCNLVDNTCGSYQPNGAACQSGAQCKSAFCVDGVCCDQACEGTCQACTATLKGAGPDGTCGNAKDGTDPHDDCADNGAESCSLDGSCNGAGACRLYAAGTACGPGVCSGNVAKAQTCSGMGACGVAGNGIDCSPFVCANGTCKASCASDADCTSGTYCKASTCVPKLDNGAPCGSKSACKSDFCVDGVCCSTACTGPCLACSAALKGAGSDGTCGGAAVGTDPNNDCPSEPASSCGKDGTCNGSGACRLHAAGTACGASQCSGNVAKGQVCNGIGSCVVSANGIDCTPFVCSGGACKVACVTAADCVSGYFCGSGACVAKHLQGEACAKGTECLSTFCVDGVCCNSACAGTCQACSKTLKGAGMDGTCGNAAAGLDPHDDCEDAGAATCKQDGTCGGNGACRLYAQGTSCGSSQCAGNSATGQVCNGAGSCILDPKGIECSPFVCLSGSCKASCDTEADCAAGHFCELGQCVPNLDIGAPCVASGQCASAHCADGVCCDVECGKPCEACTAALKGTGSDGACGGVLAGLDPDDDCPDEGAASCGLNGTCNGTGACELYAAGTSCGQSVCEGTIAKGLLCDGAGTCAANQDGVDCTPFACGEGACKATCANDSDCASGSVCVQGQCTSKLGLGEPCGSNLECASSFCVDGVCCDELCDAQCGACDAPKAGTCSAVKGEPHGNRPPCQGDGPCQGSCDGIKTAACSYAKGAPCATSCEDGSETMSACDGLGSCVPEDAVACEPYVCADAEACATSCSTDDDCADGFTCLDGHTCGPVATTSCVDERTRQGVDGVLSVHLGGGSAGRLADGHCTKSARRAARWASRAAAAVPGA